MFHPDRLKRCSQCDIPIWLTRLRHADVTHSEQEQDEEENENTGYLDNFYGDQIRIPG